jgi:hypothetical protein
MHASQPELMRWYRHRWFKAKLLCPAGVTPIVERQQLAACFSGGKMQRTSLWDRSRSNTAMALLRVTDRPADLMCQELAHLWHRGGVKRAAQ